MQRSNIEEEVVKIFVWNWKSGEGHDNYSGNNMTVMVVMVMIGLR